MKTRGSIQNQQWSAVASHRIAKEKKKEEAYKRKNTREATKPQ